jgi:hypothetical protein
MRIRLVKLGIAIGLIVFVAMGLFHVSHVRDITKSAELNRSIQAALPQGSTEQAVVNYLIAHKISYFIAKGPPPKILCIVRGVGYSFLCRTDITIKFHFDRSNRLLRYELHEVATSI